jgi:hypothetical protein
VKIYVAAMEALRISERQHEAQFCEFQPPFNVFFLFLQAFLKLIFESQPMYDQT